MSSLCILSFLDNGWTSKTRRRGFPHQGLIDHVGWTSFLEKFSSWHYDQYALLWGIARQNDVNMRGTIKGKEVVILPTTIVATSSYVEEGLVFYKD